MANSDMFGYERRNQQLKAKQKEDNKLAIKTTKEICEQEWQNFIASLHLESTKGYLAVVSDEQINDLYEKIFQRLKSELKASQIPVGLAHRLKFFNHINKQRIQANLKPFPIPVIANQPKRPANTNDLNNFLYLEKADKIVEEAMQIWQQKNSFSQLDTVTWLLFSLAVFGGYNQANILEAVYRSLKEKKPFYLMGQEQLLLPIELDSTRYANRILRLNKDDPEEVSLSYSRWVFFNDISRLWLSYLHAHFSDKNKFPSYAECIRRLSEFVGEKFYATGFAESDFLNHINIYWQTLANARIDQQMVETQLGRQPHTALTLEQLIHYFSPIKSVSSAKSTKQIVELVANKPNSNDNQINALSDNPESFEAPAIFNDDFVKVVRKMLSGQKNQIIPQLEQFYTEQALLPNQQRLIIWLIDLAKKGNKLATLKRYLSEIGNDFIAETREADFMGWQDFEYQTVYNKIVSQKNTLKMGYTQTVLASLHDVLVKEFNAPYLRINREKDPLIVESCLIPVSLFHHMLAELDNNQTIDNGLKQVLRLILILLYRTGMRFMELLLLRVSDIEYDNQTFLDYNIVLRPHLQRELKSDDATRRFMLNIVLQPNELAEFKQYFLGKVRQNARYLFTLPNQAQPIDKRHVELTFRDILDQASHDGRYRDITMHSFRHNAISNMALILRCDYSVIELFTDYSREQAQAIRYHALGKIRTVSPNFWNVLQDFAGHVDLNTTFSSYIHTADVIAHYQLSKAELQLPLQTVIKLSGKARRSFNQYNKKAVNFDNEMVNLWYIRGFINHTIPYQKLSQTTRSDIKAINQTQQQTELQIAEQPSIIFGKYERQVVEKLLNDIESGIELEQACQLNFDYVDALNIYQNALKLVQDEPAKYKFISKDRKTKSSHPLIAPTSLHYQQEITLSNLCFSNIEKLCQSKAGKREIAEFVQNFYQKTIPSKPEIRFPFKETKQFYAYLETALKILPSEYWRINISKYTPTKITDPATGKPTFTMPIDKKETNYAIKKFNEKFFDFNGDITQKTIYSGFSISMIRPNDKGKPTKKQPSSVLIKHIVHWLMIMMP